MSPAKSKVVGSPSGVVCFSTTMAPRSVFVNVQETVSPAARSIEAVRDDASAEVPPLGSLHSSLVRSNPIGSGSSSVIE